MYQARKENFVGSVWTSGFRGRVLAVSIRDECMKERTTVLSWLLIESRDRGRAGGGVSQIKEKPKLVSPYNFWLTDLCSECVSEWGRQGERGRGTCSGAWLALCSMFHCCGLKTEGSQERNGDEEGEWGMEEVKVLAQRSAGGREKGGRKEDRRELFTLRVWRWMRREKYSEAIRPRERLLSSVSLFHFVQSLFLSLSRQLGV